MIRFLDISNHTLFWYYVASNMAYLVMLLVALKTSALHQRRLESHCLGWVKENRMVPPITIIAPAHNEEASIRVAVRNLLELDYPELEVIVVNDGSEDRTLDELREAFQLRLVRAVYVPQAKCALRARAVPKRRGQETSGRRQRSGRQQGGCGQCRAERGHFSLRLRRGSDSLLERDALLRITLPGPGGSQARSCRRRDHPRAERLGNCRRRNCGAFGCRARASR